MVLTSAEPTDPEQRQQSLDLLRGIAVLGILLMNIRLFAMIEAAYFNPTAYGSLEGINALVFAVGHVFADQKFMTIFSMLFGAGIVLIGERAEARARSAAWLHYRRMFWLAVFGALHAYLLWYGDILLLYAMCGAVVVALRRRRPRTQLVLGLCMLAVSSAIFLAAQFSMPYWPEPDYLEAQATWQPDAAAIAHELALYRSSWADQLAHRVPAAAEFQTMVFSVWGFWRAGGLMLIGMALYRWGAFSAMWSTSAYRKLALAGLGLGLPVVVFGLMQHRLHGWSFDHSFFLGAQYNYWGSVLVSLGYVGLVMLWFRSGRLEALMHRLSAAGRMAFTNYIAQTLICTMLFYGHGLGWFGHAERWQQWLVVFSVWALILAWSPWWLARYRFGPLEWLWRSLTYFRPQPLVRSSARTTHRSR